MRTVKLLDVYKNPNKFEKEARKIVREAVFDEAIYVYIETPNTNKYSVWEYELDAEIESQSIYMGVSSHETYHGIKALNVVGLVLEGLDLVILDKKGIIEASSFFKGIELSDKKDEVEVICPESHDLFSSMITPWNYYIFEAAKDDTCFVSGKTVDIQITLQSLCVAIDVIKVRDYILMRDLLPQLFKLPVEIQVMLSSAPKGLCKLPSRLSIVWDVYQETWEKCSQEKGLTKKEINDFNEKVIELLSKKFGDEVREVGRPLGSKTARSIAEMLMPDYLNIENKNITDTVSHGIPSLLWILTALVEVCLTNNKNKNQMPTFDVEMIPRLLYAINRPKEKLELDMIERDFLKLFYESYPDVEYLRFVKYTKAVAAIAEKLCE